jgi:GAF domain-containing protein
MDSGATQRALDGDTAPSATENDLDLATHFALISRAIQRGGDSVSATLARVADLARHTVDGAEAAAVTVVRKGEFVTEAATDERCRLVDQIQYETGEGPCVDAMVEEATYLCPDLREERRFPRFAPRAVAETGVLSMLAVRLFAEEETLGALNLYSSRAGAFDRHEVSVAAIFASHASVAFARAKDHDHGLREVMNLERALVTNREIGTAIGIVMATDRCTEQEAFTLLRVASQHLNRKLRDVASDVVHTGLVPGSEGED